MQFKAENIPAVYKYVFTCVSVHWLSTSSEITCSHTHSNARGQCSTQQHQNDALYGVSLLLWQVTTPSGTMVFRNQYLIQGAVDALTLKGSAAHCGIKMTNGYEEWLLCICMMCPSLSVKWRPLKDGSSNTQKICKYVNHYVSQQVSLAVEQTQSRRHTSRLTEITWKENSDVLR